MLGVASEAHLTRMMGYPKGVVGEILVKMGKAGEANRVRIDGVRGDYWISRNDLDKIGKGSKEEHIALLNPLDPLLRQMSWVRSLFGYSFRKEYFRKKGMRWQLSILLDTEFVGFLDPKADRRNKTMRIRELALSRTLNEREWKRLIGGLVRFTRFHDLARLKIEHADQMTKALLRSTGFDNKGTLSLPD